MNKELKTIFVTGASSGIGKEISKLSADKGYKVFAGVRKKSDKSDLESYNKNITGVYIDVTNISSIDKAFWFIIKHADKLDVLINNAGIAVASPVECLDIKKLKEQFEVNTFGPVSIAQKFIPLLKGGKIINISSMAASGIFPYISPYCASKRALDIIFNSYNIENKDNIKVISVKPAVIRTPIWNKSIKSARELFENQNDILREKYIKDLLLLEKNASEGSKTGIDAKYVAEKVLKIINTQNPKPSYCVGIKSNLALLFSLLPSDILNKLIKLRLEKI